MFSAYRSPLSRSLPQAAGSDSAPAGHPLPRRATARAMALRAATSTGTAAWMLALAAALMVLVSQMAQAQARGTPDSFADLAERLLPAVVNISTSQTISADRSPDMPQFPPGSPFEEFFKDYLERQNPGRNGGNGGDQPTQRATSLGSGFIVDPDGYIVTNNHVIQDADEITVILSDDTALKAELIGRDAKVDIALLKVDAKRKLPYVDFGDSDKARVGDWVMAIGNPFGLGGTVTAGILSAKTRDINAGPYDSFLQTDAPINRGNSGGPLFNMDGQVVGVNTAIYSPSGGSVGIGFASPANLLKPVLEDLRKYGKTRRGWLGVRIQTVTDEIAESLGLKKARGALVAGIEDGSPAIGAGIQTGDVILEWDSREVKEMRRLPAMVAESKIGDSVPVVVWRDGERKTVKVKVGELKDEEQQAKADAPKKKETAAVESSAVKALGLSVTPVTAASRAKYNLPDTITKGLIVTDVTAKGPAEEKGIRRGNVLLEMGGKELKSAGDMAEQVAKTKESGRKSVLLLVQVGNDMKYVPVNIGN